MNTVISVKVDKEVKEKAQEVAKSMGISLSTLLNAYLRQVAVTRRAEFFAPEPMTPKLENLLREVEAEVADGKVSPVFDNVDDMIADLMAP